MSHKIRRRLARRASRSQLGSNGSSLKKELKLESLEQRLLLDVSGWWDELGFRSGSGGGITWDPTDMAGESQLVLSSDGDPVALWVEGTFNEYVQTPIPFHWEVDGTIYARQYAGSTNPDYQGLPGWWDLSDGSADGSGQINTLGSGRQISAAAGPNGEIAVVWVTGAGSSSEIYGRVWDGSDWVDMAGSNIDGGISDDGVLNEKPSIAISPVGEVFVSYTALHPGTAQREIVVKRYGYNYPDTFVGVPHPDDRVWVELTNETVGQFGEHAHSGVSNDQSTSIDSSIAIDLTGRPIVAWSSQLSQGNIEVFAKRWTGSTWAELSGHSASDHDNNGVGGISNDVGMSLQPDIAVNTEGDVIVTWVNWADWQNYDNTITANGGQAGIFVRALESGASAWTTYTTQHAGQDSATNRGLAETLGWYYSPQLDVDSSGNPVVAWQGFGAGERYAVDRDRSDAPHTPNFPDNQDRESPVMQIYASEYDGTAFELLTNNGRNSAVSAGNMTWMPDVLLGENDEIILSYTWRDSTIEAFNHDYEVYVQQWDSTSNAWTEYGRGSNSNGNDVLNSVSRPDGPQQLGLIDYSENALDPDVMVAQGARAILDLGGNIVVPNRGQLFRYSRVDDAWHTDIDLADGFGEVFDLKGDPDMEYDIAGNPLLAYLDDATGLPYVYQWIDNTDSWSLVGGAEASAIAGNNRYNDIDGDGNNGNRNQGVSVQAGPNGQILLTYITFTTTSAQGGSKTDAGGIGSDDLVTILWDGTAWTNVDDGVLEKDPAMGVAFYADFDGYDFTEDNISEAKDENTDGIINDADYEVGNLYYYTNAEDVAEVSIEDGTGGDVGAAGATGNIYDAGLVMAYEIPTVEDAGEDWPGAGTDTASIYLDNRMYSWGDDLIVSFDYSMLGYANGTLELFLYVDGEKMDMDPDTPGVIDPFTPTTSATELMIPYSDDTHVEVDLTAIIDAMIANNDLAADFSTGPGVHTIRLQSDMTIGLFPSEDDGEQPANVRIDNFNVYQRIVGQSGYVVGGTAVYPRQSDLNFTFNRSNENWSFTPNSLDVTGGYNAGAGSSGTDDGGLLITLGDGINVGNSLSGVYEYEFELAAASTVNLDLDYSLFLGADIGGAETLKLSYNLDGGGWIDIDTDTGPGTTAYTSAATINLNGGANLTADIHTLQLKGELSNSASAAIVDQDFEGAGAIPAGWAFIDDPVRPGHTDGNWYNEANDVLRMTLGDGTVAAAGLQAAFTGEFTVGSQSDVAVNLNYILSNGNGLQATDVLDMSIWVENLGSGAMTQITSVGDYQSTGPGAVGTGTVSKLSLGTLAAGNYKLHVRGNLSSSRGAANGVAEVTVDDVQIYEQARGRGKVYIDNVNLSDPSGTIELIAPSTAIVAVEPMNSTGGNHNVGPLYDAEGNRLFDFGESTYLTQTGGGPGETVMDSWLINDVITEEDGPMIIGFRYRLRTDGDPANTNLAVRIDGELYNASGENDFVATPVPDYGLIYANGGDTGWWNGNQYYPEYTYVYVIAEDITAGTHTVRLELNVADEANTTTSELWIDNLSVIVARPTNAADPHATLLPNRNFAVGITNQSVGLGLYGDDDADPSIDAYLRSFTSEFVSGYSTVSIFEQDAVNDEWDKYGDLLSFTQPIDFLGFSLKENLQSGSIADTAGLGNYTYEMPAPELYTLSDLTIGPNGFVWAALQHADSEWVDTNDDGELDAFHVHPWDGSVPYWGSPTTLDFEVWRWQPYNSPTNVDGNPDRWVNTEAVPRISSRAYTNVQMVGSGSQLPTVAWTRRNPDGNRTDSAALRYQDDDTWGVLNTESIQNAGQMSMWSSLRLDDMIVRPDGYPIVSFYMTHLGANGVREFNTDATMPNLVITEQSGTANDDLLEFGSTSGKIVDQAFSINNAGGGDLTVYGIEIGGTGSLNPSPFSLRDDLAFPFTLRGNALTGIGESLSVAVRFDPKNAPDGDYSAVLIVHSNDPDHPDHPFSHFYDIVLHATSQNDAEMTVSPRQLSFPDTIKNETSTMRTTVIRNRGVENLTISEWYFAGVNYSISDVEMTNGEIVTPNMPTTNNKGSADDVILEPNAYLTFTIVFNPTEVANLTDTFYIHSDDKNLEYAAVALFGEGISGAAMTVTENVGTPNNDTIEFGSVIQDQSETQSFTITNDGSTDLTIVSITDVNNNPLITFVPLIDNRLLGPAESLIIYVTFAPEGPDPGQTAVAEELDTTLRILSDDPYEASYQVFLTGLSVPQVPIISIEEVAAANDAIDNMVLDFVSTNIQIPVTRQFTIENLGGADLTIDSFVLSNTTDFSVSPVNQQNNSGDDIVLPYDSAAQTVTVTFDPTEARYYDETLRVFYRNADNELVSQIFTLQARALNASLLVTDSQGAADDQQVNFGPISQNLASTVETVTMTNNGTSNLNITGWSLTSGDADIFEVDPFSGTTISLAPNASTSFDVVFAPNMVQNYTGQVTITSDDASNPAVTVDLSGQGSAPGLVTVVDQNGAAVIHVDFTPGAPLVYGIGESVSQSFTLRNSSDVPILLKGLTTESAMFMLNRRLNPNNDNDDIIMPIGGELDFAVTFDAANLFSGSTDLVIVTNNVEDTGDDVATTVTMEAETVYAPRVGAGGSMILPWVDENDHSVSFIMFGGGSAVILPADTTSTSGAIDTIKFIGTSSRTIFMAQTSGSIDVGSITGTAIGTMLLNNVNLVGSGMDIQGLSSYMTLGDLDNGADISIDSTFGRAPILQLGDVGSGSDIDVNGDVLMFRPATFGNATFSAEDVTIMNLSGASTGGSVHLSGNLNMALLNAASVNTDFIVDGNIRFLAGARATYSGAVRADNISYAMFGSLSGASISASSRVGYVSASGNMFDSLILGGYDLGNDGRLGGGDDVLFSGGRIDNVSVSGRVRDSFVAAGIAPTGNDFFTPADTATGSIGMVRFGSALDGTNAFGVAAHTNINSVLLGNTRLQPGDSQGDFEVHLL